MLTKDEKKTISKGIVTSWVIWASIMGSLVVYLIVCHVMGNEFQANLSNDLPVSLIKTILFAVSVITFLLTPLLKKYMLNSSGKSISGTSDSNQHQSPFLARYMTILVLTMFLSESIAIYGLILFFLGEGLQTMYIFTALSALALFVFRPVREEFETLAKAMRTDKTANR